MAFKGHVQKSMNVLLNEFSTLWLENRSSGSLVWRADHLGSECGKPGELC